ncbi:hypothetical protein [Acetobacter sp.]|jgi:hypothetical protein|uniref:hypothetical protein n=1 Tax=Acetobacter sp. TaxID=440 RepID=UPI0025BFF4A2|nr:hypothetical protein [Acetobacter sp.]MCH4091962.1 hypothetical protein [Acetobacter sp.]MCI1301118.1 hypothetical protein [Acetobacter sp.]MCI1317311.1 hypothetical protein [Acetobacter sp.]
MRELTTTEMTEVSGGCWNYNPCGYQPVVCGPSAATIAAYAGYLAGEYNIRADIFNGASCSTIQSAISNMYADTKLGYTEGLSMTVAQAKTLLGNVQSAIRGAVTTNRWGCITAMTTITFPPSASGGLG